MNNKNPLLTLREYLAELDKQNREKEKNYLQKQETVIPTAPLASNVTGNAGGNTGSSAGSNTGSSAGSSTDTNRSDPIQDAIDAILANREGEQYRETVAGVAGNQTDRGNALSDTATGKSNQLYEALLAFTGKQDGRYDQLLQAIAQNDYAKAPGSGEILSRYEQAGEKAAGHAIAESAADNGGNPDSYAAAQANRQRLSFTEAGEAQAAAQYGEQLDRLLTAIQASSGDLSDLFSLLQDNTDSDREAAADHIAAGESLFSSLLDAQNDARDTSAETLSTLFDQLTSGRYLGNLSPMQIDREFLQLTTPGDGTQSAYSDRDALILLWDKYPTMRTYLLEKYEKFNEEPPYTFQ